LQIDLKLTEVLLLIIITNNVISFYDVDFILFSDCEIYLFFLVKISLDIELSISQIKKLCTVNTAIVIRRRRVLES
jgi:hypothetical protein